MLVTSKNFKVSLRVLTVDDADSIAEHANDYDVVYNIAELGSFPFPYKRSDALQFIDAATRALINGTEFHYGIVIKETDELVGIAGIKNIDYKNRKCEIGYWVGKKFWGNGYAKEAISLLLGVAFSSLGMNRVYATVFTFNERSLKVLESLSFVKEGVMRHSVFHVDKFVDDIMLSLLKSEYKPAEKIEIFSEE
jgi:ribosomal-protein-alanine N-acetyltransferase